jgi:hypothetical protein
LSKSKKSEKSGAITSPWQDHKRPPAPADGAVLG